MFPAGMGCRLLGKGNCYHRFWEFLLPVRKSMKPLLFLANAFINTFGITQPSEAAAKRAAQFIAVLIGLMLLVFAGVVAFGIFFLMRN